MLRKLRQRQRNGPRRYHLPPRTLQVPCCLCCKNSLKLSPHRPTDETPQTPRPYQAPCAAPSLAPLQPRQRSSLAQSPKALPHQKVNVAHRSVWLAHTDPCPVIVCCPPTATRLSARALANKPALPTLRSAARGSAGTGSSGARAPVAPTTAPTCEHVDLTLESSDDERAPPPKSEWKGCLQPRATLSWHHRAALPAVC